MTDTSSRRLAADPGMRRVRAYARRANSEDSIEVLSTTESIFPDDLTAITEEEAEYQPQNGRENEKEPTTECKSDHVHKEKTLHAAVSVNGDEKDESLKHIPADGEVLVKEEQIIECLKSDRIHEDKPVKKSKLLQGNTSATVSITEVEYSFYKVNSVISCSCVTCTDGTETLYSSSVSMQVHKQVIHIKTPELLRT